MWLNITEKFREQLYFFRLIKIIILAAYMSYFRYDAPTPFNKKYFNFNRHSRGAALNYFCMLFQLIKMTIAVVYMRYFLSADQPSNKKKKKYFNRQSLNNVLSNFRILFQYFNKTFVNSKWVIVDYDDCRGVATSLEGLTAFAWLCEKMHINIKVKHPTRTTLRFFENGTLINTTKESGKDCESPTPWVFSAAMGWHGAYFVSSEYGHKVLSKLSIKEDLKKTADEWFAKHIKGDWVAVHYRGTDVVAEKDKLKGRYRIDLEPYIEYLQGVLDSQGSIFACSDQAQFIDKMKEAFPGRVFARDITRSYTLERLHYYRCSLEEVDNFNQERDALIDILILAKAELIYTTGSGFVDVVRYFNPKIKIASMDDRRINRSENNVPIPRKDLFDKLCRPL